MFKSELTGSGELRKRGRISQVTEEISSSNIVKSIKNFDLYTKTQDVAITKTGSGGFISIIAIIILGILLISEIKLFFTVTRKDTLGVDLESTGVIPIYMNITFPNVICKDLHLDAVDQSGSNQLNVKNRVFKLPVSQTGRIIGVERATRLQASALAGGGYNPLLDEESPFYCGSCYAAASYNNKQMCCNSCEDVKEAYKRAGLTLPPLQEIDQCLNELTEEVTGCNIFGFLEVQKVAGNFHFAPGRSFSQEHEHNVHHIHEFNPILVNRFNSSHVIHSLRFGPSIPHVVYPLEDTTTVSGSGITVHKYFIKVVPTTYRAGWFTHISSNQYSFTKHQQTFDPNKVIALPGIFFVYDFSPIKITYKDSGEPFLHFIVRLCAIFGGVFTVFGYTNRFVSFVASQVQKKQS